MPKHPRDARALRAARRAALRATANAKRDKKREELRLKRRQAERRAKDDELATLEAKAQARMKSRKAWGNAELQEQWEDEKMGELCFDQELPPLRLWAQLILAKDADAIEAYDWRLSYYDNPCCDPDWCDDMFWPLVHASDEPRKLVRFLLEQSNHPVATGKPEHASFVREWCRYFGMPYWQDLPEDQRPRMVSVLDALGL